MRKNLISISGGKDSTALVLLAVERGVEFETVFADTGHEHPMTYDFVRYLSGWLEARGFGSIRWVRADFSKDIERKRRYVEEKWPVKLAAEMKTSTLVDETSGAPMQFPRYTQRQIAEIVSRAIAVLKPTGNPFLDLCIMKGRFASTMARFCSQELKHQPIYYQVVEPLIEAGHEVYSWQGVRADESASRAKLEELEEVGGGLWNYRPILRWNVEQVFDMHRRHGIEPNPLYKLGMGRVGCMPCIHSRKDEIREIAARWPEEIERVAEWERIVSQASKRGNATFFAADKADAKGLENDSVSLATHGIHAIVEWSRTTKNGKQLDLVSIFEEPAMCSSIYGLCE